MSRPDALTVEALLREQSARQPDAVSILGLEAPPLTAAGLTALIDRTRLALRALGFGARDRLGLVLANGPEAATGFLAIAASGACAPLNPAYTQAELEFALADIGASALVVPEGRFPAAEAAAGALRLPLVRLHAVEGAPAGVFQLGTGQQAPTPTQPDALRGPDDVALLLHTSGTTSRPKLVPLRQRHLATSAVAIAEALGLGPADRCLNVMPLFHVHGLVGALLSSLSAGASVICTPGFHALRFSSWLDDHAPTWFTAVPTMHQAILARLARRPPEAHTLRFVRSCSAPLPPRVHRDLEACFRVPVVEAYGMTEAAHQIACNPLPPGQRRPGSVGLPTGTSVAIMDDGGRLLPPGETGEIVIRGPAVTDGYERNEEANASAFVDGWFRTGDQGWLGADGYVHLAGRLKEIINRGGEKISPVEVDGALADHPAVRFAVAFALPHDTLGEDIAAAVVLAEGETVGESELRAFVRERLAAFKVPSRILFVGEIPKGPTGKLQRIGLASALGLS